MKIAQLPQRKRRQNIIVAILIIGLPLLLFAAYQVVQIVSRASGDTDPKNVVLSNVTPTMSVISWTTDTKTYGSVILVENDREKSEVKDARGSDRRNTHYVELESLEPNTKYNFKIKSGNTKYTSSEGKDLVFTTAPITADLPSINHVSGRIESASDDDILIYVLLEDKTSFPASATLMNDKAWITDLSGLLKIADRSRVDVNENSVIAVLATDGRGNGAELTGMYSSLFDNDSRLKESNQLVLSAGTEIYSKIPAEAKLAVSIPPVTSEEPKDPVVIDKKPPVKPVTPTEPLEEDIPDEEFTDRKYRIVHHLQWLELAEVSRVSTNVGPESIRVSNLTDVGFTVLWISEEKENGLVKYGVSQNDLSNTAYDQRDGISAKGKYYVHSVKLDRLQSETKYYYEIISGEDLYDNNERKYSVTTLATVESAPPFTTLSGSFTNMPSHGEVIVIGSVKDMDKIGSLGTSYEVSTLVDERGNWTMPIGDLRFDDSTSYFEYTSEDRLIIEPFTTFKTSKKEESMDGIDKRDIKIALESLSSTEPTTSISQLSNYGITNDPNAVTITGTTTTPNTGIMDNFIGIVLISISLVIFGVLLYFSSRKRTKGNGKMSRNL
ncbi:MAG: fibronectin type III domain-containing protein [Candidatus Dojkabacteria bacterium]|jgi:hypothetical protein